MKKFKYIIVLFVMGLISFSCTDLDEEIFSEITTDNSLLSKEITP